MFDRVILSSNEHENYIEFWPLVSWAWKTLFNKSVDLAFVTKREENDPFIENLRIYGNVFIFPEIDGIPSANNAKMARHYLASTYEDEVCIINDIDLLILQRDYILDMMKYYRDGCLLSAGNDVYTGKEIGKFPIGYITAQGKIFKSLLNPNNYVYRDFLKSFEGLEIFDKKENILNAINNEHPDTFSDESLYRAMISKWDNKDKVIYLPRGFSSYMDRAIDRFDWQNDREKLKQNVYIEAHLPRPYHKHVHQVEPLIERIKEIAKNEYQ